MPLYNHATASRCFYLLPVCGRKIEFEKFKPKAFFKRFNPEFESVGIAGEIQQWKPTYRRFKKQNLAIAQCKINRL